MTMPNGIHPIRDQYATPNTGDSLLAPGRVPPGRSYYGGPIVDYGPGSTFGLDSFRWIPTGVKGRQGEPPGLAGPFVGEVPRGEMDPFLRAYQFGINRPSPEIVGGLTPLLGERAGGLLEAIEARSPLRTASWAEPMRQYLDPEVRQAISAMEGLVPSRLGITAYYGDLARAVQELVGAPELGVARQYIGSRLSEGIPEDLLGGYRQDIRAAQAARGLSYGPAAASDEAVQLARLREAQRQALLGPAMTLGFQTLGMSGFPEMAQIGTVNFAPVGTAEELHQQRQYANRALNWQVGFAGAESALGLAGLLAGLPGG